MGSSLPSAPSAVMDVKMVVACSRSTGAPDFTFCIVRCRKHQYDCGEHYVAAESDAREDGYEGSMVVFDEYDAADGPAWLFGHFEWAERASPVDITGDAGVDAEGADDEQSEEG